MLHSSLLPLTAHLSRSVHCNLLHGTAGRLEAKLADALYSLMHRPCILGSPEDKRIALPLRLGGFELCCMDPCMTPCKLLAVQLSAAALTQVAMQGCPGEYRPFDGRLRVHMQGS